MTTGLTSRLSPEPHAVVRDASALSDLLAAFRQCRLDAGLSLAQAAQLAGMDEDEAAQLEGGASDPSILSLMAYGRAVGMTMTLRSPDTT